MKKCNVHPETETILDNVHIHKREAPPKQRPPSLKHSRRTLFHHDSGTKPSCTTEFTWHSMLPKLVTVNHLSPKVDRSQRGHLRIPWAFVMPSPFHLRIPWFTSPQLLTWQKHTWNNLRLDPQVHRRLLRIDRQPAPKTFSKKWHRLQFNPTATLSSCVCETRS